MKLLVISHTPHYRRGEQVVGWGPTVRELDYLATRFDELVHLAILHPVEPPASSLPYTSEKVSTIFLPPAGGNRLRKKTGVLKLAPTYLRAIRRQIGAADIVQVRCPANISFLALLTLILSAKPLYRWFKYAGNWQPVAGEVALSSRIQRWLLITKWARGPVTINGHWPNQPAHIYSFENPCLTQIEIEQAQQFTANKKLDEPIQFMFVGRAENAKGLGEAMQILARLKEYGVDLLFDVIGGGPEQEDFEAQAVALGIGEQTHFRGFLPRPELSPFYARAHFLLHPSHSEGWPKVLSEAMAYGVVPLASNISRIPQTLAEIGCGLALPSTATDLYVTEILDYRARPERWRSESQRGKQSAYRFSYEAYGTALEKMFRRAWGISLPL